MTMHFIRELEQLKNSMVDFCAQVEKRTQIATAAVIDRDGENAGKIIATAHEIDDLELAIEENCLKILALYQPVAVDLRFVVATVKISNTLERVGALAVNLAKKARALTRQAPMTLPAEFAEMSARANAMLKDSIDAFVKLDPAPARKIELADDEVDHRKRQVKKIAEAAIIAAPETAPQWITIIAASRNLERIADLAVDIAAQIIYLVEGKIVRTSGESE
ncbi:phosphate transport system regulatory protein PhoU [Planctomycetales bacterium]|nr:phosphate transport system regulatory protein PhoU [Planctomycetales bacterium]GHT06410.1 phosphate transport system regulatory protein PhoU [Planctomycetales bacterium]